MRKGKQKGERSCSQNSKNSNSKDHKNSDKNKKSKNSWFGDHKESKSLQSKRNKGNQVPQCKVVIEWISVYEYLCRA